MKLIGVRIFSTSTVSNNKNSYRLRIRTWLTNCNTSYDDDYKDNCYNDKYPHLKCFWLFSIFSYKIFTRISKHSVQNIYMYESTIDPSKVATGCIRNPIISPVTYRRLESIPSITTIKQARLYCSTPSSYQSLPANLPSSFKTQQTFPLISSTKSPNTWHLLSLRIILIFTSPLSIRVSIEIRW